MNVVEAPVVEAPASSPVVVMIEESRLQKDLDAIRELVGAGKWIRNNTSLDGKGCIWGLANKVSDGRR